MNPTTVASLRVDEWERIVRTIESMPNHVMRTEYADKKLYLRWDVFRVPYVADSSSQTIIELYEFFQTCEGRFMFSIYGTFLAFERKRDALMYKLTFGDAQ